MPFKEVMRSGKLPVGSKSNAGSPDAARLYRKLLAAERDGEVIVVTVGDITNLRDLLATKPDEHSPLAGRDLVRRKVKGWVCMGGSYPRHLDPTVFGNFKPDAASTVEAVANWPTTIYFCGLGDDILTGEPLRATPRDNPVRRSYELYLGTKPTRPSRDGTERRSLDDPRNGELKHGSACFSDNDRRDETSAATLALSGAVFHSR